MTTDLSPQSLYALAISMQALHGWELEFEFRGTEKDMAQFVQTKVLQFEDGRMAEHQNGCTFSIDHNILSVGDPREHALLELKGFHSSNLAVFIKARILNAGGNLDNWLGVQFRGFKPATSGGYVLYVRAQGTMEIFSPEYRATIISDLGYKIPKWLEILFIAKDKNLSGFSLLDTENMKEFHYQNLTFESDGWISIQTYCTTAEIDNFVVWHL